MYLGFIRFYCAQCILIKFLSSVMSSFSRPPVARAAAATHLPQRGVRPRSVPAPPGMLCASRVASAAAANRAGGRGRGGCAWSVTASQAWPGTAIRPRDKGPGACRAMATVRRSYARRAWCWRPSLGHSTLQAQSQLPAATGGPCADTVLATAPGSKPSSTAAAALRRTHA